MNTNDKSSLPPSGLIQEQLSALWDGELNVVEAQLLEKRLERDPELSKTLMRYSLMGAVMRAQSPPRAIDVTPSVRAKLNASEDSVSQAPSAANPHTTQESSVINPVSRYKGWQQVLGGLAVAASVAMVSVWLIQKYTDPQALTARVDSQSTHGVVVKARVAHSAAEHAFRDRLVAEQLVSSHDEPFSYVTPKPSLSVMPKSELNRYVAAHVALSSPSVEQNTLMNLLADEGD